LVTWLRRTVRVGASAGAALAAVGLALAMLPPSSWVSELADPWRLHLAAVLAVCALGLGRPPLTATALVVAAAVSIPPLASRFRAPFGATAAAAGERTLSLVTFNLEHDNPHKAEAVAWLSAVDADVIVLEEVDPAWAAALQGVAGRPHRAVFPQDGHFGVALLSDVPIRDAVTRSTGAIPTTTLVAAVGDEHDPLRLLVTHTMPPIAPEHAEERARDLADVAALVGPGPRRTVLAGDLNAPPWAPVLRELLATTGLVDSGRGFGLQPTWPAPLAPVGIPIDHVLVSPDVAVVEREVGPDLGSDHRPVRVVLSW
jgi:endonuclease/exonuclease/phosphatase (EEP) superfamily protein YafD